MSTETGQDTHHEVTGVGAAVVDYIGVVDRYPAPDTQVELQHFSKQAGGNVATALATLARLGTRSSYIGKFGDDELAGHLRSTLQQQGVDLSHSITQAGSSMGFAFIIVEEGSGKRTILYTNQGKPELHESEIDPEAILASRFLHLDHYSMNGAIAAARIAQQGDVQVVLDAESMHPDIDVLLPMVDILIACADFATQYTSEPDCMQSLNQLYNALPAHTVVITAGERGSFCRDAIQTHRQPAFAIPIVDTTGCGDVYHGAFIYGLLQAWPLPKTAEFASAAAALNCQGLGGQSAIPSRPQVEAFLASASPLPL